MFVARLIQFRRLLLWSLLTAVCASCSKAPAGPKNRASASGIVTVDGTPLPSGRILFHSISGPITVPVSIYEAGKYSTDRAPLGKNVVTIDTSFVKFSNPSSYVPIADKYNETQTSGLVVDLQPGKNENIDFKLEK